MKNVLTISLSLFLFTSLSYAGDKNHDNIMKIIKNTFPLDYPSFEKDLAKDKYCGEMHHAFSASGNTLLFLTRDPEKDEDNYSLYLIELDTELDPELEEGEKREKKRTLSTVIAPIEENMDVLRRYQWFKNYAFPVITSLKIWSKNNNLKIPKPLVSSILKYGYCSYQYLIKKPEYDSYIAYIIKEDFPSYTTISSLFVDDNRNIVINFENENNKNLLYIQKENQKNRLITPGETTFDLFKKAYPQYMIISDLNVIDDNENIALSTLKNLQEDEKLVYVKNKNLLYVEKAPGEYELVTPKQITNEEMVDPIKKVNPQLCSPGKIKIISIIDKENSTLTAIKDGKEYLVDL